MPGLGALLKRDHTLFGGVLFGIDGHVIELQARAVEALDEPQPWRQAVTITGMAGGAVSEAMDRITGAFAKFAIPRPEVEILTNLAPADLLKEGTSLDLPLAIIILQAAGMLPDLPEQVEEQFLLMGELGLHGEIRRVPGVLSIAACTQAGRTLIVPRGNEKECALILASPGHEGCRVCAVETLEEVIHFFQGKRKLDNALTQRVEFTNVVPKCVDFGRIRGQDEAKEAALLAAAGGHNLLLVGTPGEGKSLLAGAIPGILPRLRDPEKVELTRIYSACGELPNDGDVVARRPMRSVHHTASKQAIVGGGSRIPRPGEVTLAHLGVLFLDELPEFSASTLDALRQPLEDGVVHVSRVGGTMTFPCRFTLVAAMNPCRCGYYGSDACRCRPGDVQRYQAKISGPILDRIDLQVEMARLTTEDRFAEARDQDSPMLRQRVEAARYRQHSRFRDTGIPFNAAIPGGHVLDYCQFSPPALDRYKAIVDQNRVTTRSVDRLAKVARTVADLAESDMLMPDHVDRAAQFVLGGPMRKAFA